MRVLITGASGFVGRAVFSRCAADPAFQTMGTVRHHAADASASGRVVPIGDLGPNTEWSGVLKGVDVIVHTAAHVHRLKDRARDALSVYRRVNVEGTVRLAQQAVAAGVSRLVFLSSIKVHGENTLPGRPYGPGDAPMPTGPYAISKHEAEEELRQLARETGLDVVVIRSVLVYGPGVKGNVLTMMRWLEKGIPLPFGRIHNQRSLVALDNLVDLIVECLHHPAAANQTFLVSDGEDLSTTELLRRTAAAMSRPARLIPVPVFLLRTIARLLGHPELAQRLCSSLQVDISKTREVLGWTPKVSIDSALRDTACEYLLRETR